MHIMNSTQNIFNSIYRLDTWRASSQLLGSSFSGLVVIYRLVLCAQWTPPLFWKIHFKTKQIFWDLLKDIWNLCKGTAQTGIESRVHHYLEHRACPPEVVCVAKGARHHTPCSSKMIFPVSPFLCRLIMIEPSWILREWSAILRMTE